MRLTEENHSLKLEVENLRKKLSENDKNFSTKKRKRQDNDKNKDEGEDESDGEGEKPTKRQRRASTTTTTTTATTTTTTGTTTATTPVTEKVAAKIITAKKKLLAQHVKSKLKPMKFWAGYNREAHTVNVDEILTQGEFDSIFGSYGTLEQPTPQNKPTSKVIIRNLSSDDMAKIFGSQFVDFKVNVWRKGGGSTFRKSIKLGQEVISVEDCVVKYSQPSSKVSLKFSCINSGESYGAGDDCVVS